jgi:zinc transporter 1/2/3
MKVPRHVFFICKYFGSGVIVSTAFIHLLVPAQEALGSECLEGPITEYPWVAGIILMTIFVMFFIELMANQFDFFGGGLAHGHSHGPGHTHSHDLDHVSDPGSSGHGHALRVVAFRETPDDSVTKGPAAARQETVQQTPTTDATQESINESSSDRDVEAYKEEPCTQLHTREADLSYPPGGTDHLGHSRSHTDHHEAWASQMMGIFILEFGVIFHSIFIGLTLAVAGEEFVILYIVLVFHQTFEGLGLGSRLGTAEWPRGKGFLPWVMGAAYGVTTPIAIAIGLGVRETLTPGDPKMLIVNGVFDSVSAGILIYTGLVELMAHEFMFSEEMKRGGVKRILAAYGCMVLGAGLMALLGKWA